MSCQDVSGYSTDNIKHCKLLKHLLSYQLAFLVNTWKVQGSYLKALLRSAGLEALKAIQNITFFLDSALWRRGSIYILGVIYLFMYIGREVSDERMKEKQFSLLLK